MSIKYSLFDNITYQPPFASDTSASPKRWGFHTNTQIPEAATLLKSKLHKITKTKIFIYFTKERKKSEKQTASDTNAKQVPKWPRMRS